MSLDDKLSPMVVKELRQSLRGKVFISTYLAIQGMMLFALLGAYFSENFFSFFWIVLGIALLVVLPSYGLNAMSCEIQGHTLELLVMTRLTSWGIVVGKWLSLVAQALLFVCAVLPYLFLHYFLGGSDLVPDFISLALLLMASAVLCATTVGFSTYLSWWFRGMVVGALVVIILSHLSLFLGTFTFSYPGKLMVWLAIYGPLLSGLMLEVGAAQIAPPAENHALRLRLFGFVFAVVGPFLAYGGMEEWLALAPAYGVVISLGLYALLEVPFLSRSKALSWVKQPLPLRGLLAMLAPGWPSGLFYLILSLSLLSGLTWWCAPSFLSTKPKELYLVLLTISLLGSLSFPFALLRFVFPKYHVTVIDFFWVQLFALLLTTFIFLLEEALGWVGKETYLTVVLSFFPPCSFFLFWMKDSLAMDRLILLGGVSSGMTLVGILLLLYRGWPYFCIESKEFGERKHQGAAIHGTK